MEAGVEGTEDYKCSRCQTWTVHWSTDWMTFSTRHGQEICSKYACTKCDQETWIQTRDDYYEVGDTVDL